MIVSPDLQPPYHHWFPLVRFYWNRVQNTVAKLVDCAPADLILDFGCGREKILRKYLLRHNIVSYDIMKEYSEIENYRNLRPHTIICSHVLEHLTKSQLEQTLCDFVAINPRFIITAQPTENLLAQLAWLFSGQKKLTKRLRVIDHKLSIDEVQETLSRYFTLKDRKNVMTLTVVSKWIPKHAEPK